MGSRRISSITFGKEKLEWWSYQILAGGDKRLRIRPVVSTKYRRVTDMTDRRTDGQTFSHGTIGAYTEHRAEKRIFCPEMWRILKRPHIGSKQT